MELLRFTGETILGELIIVVIGVLFANVIKERIEQWRYGGWQVVVLQGGRQIVARDVSPRKVHEVLEEPADLVTFLKGVASPYAWIHCDLITEGQQLGLLVVDRAQRRFVIDLDKNPKRERPSGAPTGD